MAEGDAHLAQGFVRRILARDAHEIGRPFRIVAQGEFEGAVGLFGLVEEFGLRLATLKGGKHGPQIGQAPLHGDLGFPVELLFAGLAGGIHKHGPLGLVEPEADDAASAATVGLVDGVIRRAVGGSGASVALAGNGGRSGKWSGGWFKDSGFHDVVWF